MQVVLRRIMAITVSAAGVATCIFAVQAGEMAVSAASTLRAARTYEPINAIRRQVPTVPRLLAVSSAAPYTVRPGDTLSSIAKHFYGNPNYWPNIYWANHPHPVVWADLITVGEQLSLPPMPAHVAAWPSQLAPAPVVVTVSAPATSPPPAAPVQTAPVSTAPISTAGDSSFAQCVVERESGGNPQVMNSTGHYGLFQFSYSTWVAYGGAPGAFGDATAAQQWQVFNTAMALPGGADNWAPYDGC
jgi:LysM repeat protein